ncbi:hypothetical protein MASR1M107_24960 [Ignavibacteriales bacterium]
MTRKIFISFLIIAITHYFLGCVVYKDGKEFDVIKLEGKDTKIKMAVMPDGTSYSFKKKGASVITKDERLIVSGIADTDSLVELKAEDVLYLIVEKEDLLMSFIGSIGLVSAVLAVAFLVALAAKKSCPFIYSFDGEKYAFDAEPLGGAISKVFERTDYSKLENLKEVDGLYKLKITNEVHETEYIDEMSLIIVDHPKNTIAVMNNNGDIFALNEGEKVSYAVDQKGNDLKPFLIEDDMIAWQTKMPVSDTTLKKHKINFGFKKKQGAQKGWLVYNVGTTHWGSTMISEMLGLHGKNLEEHYRNLDKKGEYYNTTMNFLQREELYEMNLYLKENNKWESKGILQGGGPFKTEKRVIELDLSKTNDEFIEFELNPPVGFWTLDNFSLCFDEPGTTNSTEVKVSKTVTHDGKDISTIISKSDETYHQMPTTGDWFTAEYDAPKTKPGMTRSVFMKTKGWYKIDMPVSDKEPDLLTLFKLISKPGEVINFSNERYQKWILSAEK